MGLGVEARKPVRLLLVDDSDVYRSTMEVVLGREPSLQVVASVAVPDEVVPSAASFSSIWCCSTTGSPEPTVRA